LVYTKYKDDVSNEIILIKSNPDVGVGIYDDLDICNTVDGNDTVADPVVDINRVVVWPGVILLGLIKVLVFGTSCKVKKLPLFKFNDAVFEAIDKALVFSITDPVVIVEPVIAKEPVINTFWFNVFK